MSSDKAGDFGWRLLPASAHRLQNPVHDLVPRSTMSIMVAALQERNGIALDQIDQAVFLGNSAAPTTLESAVTQRFGLANALEWLFKNGSNERIDFSGCLRLG